MLLGSQLLFTLELLFALDGGLDLVAELLKRLDLLDVLGELLDEHSCHYPEYDPLALLTFAPSITQGKTEALAGIIWLMADSLPELSRVIRMTL